MKNARRGPRRRKAGDAARVSARDQSLTRPVDNVLSKGVVLSGGAACWVSPTWIRSICA